jgi:hypothetical protein
VPSITHFEITPHLWIAARARVPGVNELDLAGLERACRG